MKQFSETVKSENLLFQLGVDCWMELEEAKGKRSMKHEASHEEQEAYKKKEVFNKFEISIDLKAKQCVKNIPRRIRTRLQKAKDRMSDAKKCLETIQIDTLSHTQKNPT
ncbi:CLUMA_CG009607, isoform A [Clunio marinus]|uniref:CLUMA_CG009607, isoform A n=1 Tax=Clunio marinus TaxID=568069 RepID=A0A1J1I8Y1_9DIPT|nr:CLUMA_CG009607, isoform A [Clunio marinus]